MDEIMNEIMNVKDPYDPFMTMNNNQASSGGSQIGEIVPGGDEPTFED